MSGSQSAVGLPDWSLSPFIRLFYQRSQQPWQLLRWSSLACFHDIVGKPWHLISLREMGFERWGTRVAKPSSPRYMIYCTSAAGCEKCFYPWTSCLRSSFSVSLSFMLTKLLFFSTGYFFRRLLWPAEVFCCCRWPVWLGNSCQVRCFCRCSYWVQVVKPC